MPDQPDPAVLLELPVFSSLGPARAEELASLVFQKHYEKGATLFVEGMSGEVLYVVRSGSIEITQRGADGKEKRLALLGKGETLGEMSLVDNRPRTATARVVEDADLLVMTKKAFVFMQEKYPQLAIKVLLEFLKIANERLRRANETVKNV